MTSAVRSAVYARDTYVKKHHPQAKLLNHYSSYVQFFAYGEETKLPCHAINHLIYFIHEKMEQRTAKQNEVIEIVESNPTLTYKEIIDLIPSHEYSEASISKLLRRADYQLVQEAKTSLIQLLDMLQNHENTKEGS